MAGKTKNVAETRRGRRPEPREHGSRKGYAQHLRNGETPCEECKVVENDYQKEQRAIRVAEGRQPKRTYVPRVPKVRVYLDPALIDSFLRGRDDAVIAELRGELREALDAAKDAHGTDLVKRSRDERNAA